MLNCTLHCVRHTATYIINNVCSWNRDVHDINKCLNRTKIYCVTSQHVAHVCKLSLDYMYKQLF